MNPIDQYILKGCGRCVLYNTSDCKVHTWTDEIRELRSIVLSTGLKEELKWGVPCYTYQNTNVAIVSALRNHCSISFFKGLLIDDQFSLLEQPGKGSQATRVIKFTSVNQIRAHKHELGLLLKKAIRTEKEGKKVEFKKNLEPIPNELILLFETNPVLKSAFGSLTPGRQQGLHTILFSSKTKSNTNK